MKSISMEVKRERNWEHSLGQTDTGVSFGKNILVRMLSFGALLALVGSLGCLLYFIRPGGSSIILHYNVYFGVDLIGVWWQAYALPTLGVIFFLGHLFLARRFYLKSERIAAYLMLLSAGMLSFGLLIASVSIAFINY